jgi:hypothetical protein
MADPLAIGALVVSAITAVATILVHYNCKSCRSGCCESDCFNPHETTLTNANPIIIHERQESPRYYINQESPRYFIQESPRCNRESRDHQESPRCNRESRDHQESPRLKSRDHQESPRLKSRDHQESPKCNRESRDQESPRLKSRDHQESPKCNREHQYSRHPPASDVIQEEPKASILPLTTQVIRGRDPRPRSPILLSTSKI